jgi:release factor glutamine methyltransferase
MNKGIIRVEDINALFREKLGHLYSVNEIRAFLDLLFQHFMGWSRSGILLNRDTVLPGNILAGFSDALDALSAHKPIQYITGTTWFLGIKVAVRPGVLIPRPETEELVSWILEENPPDIKQRFTVVDIGTGSGCISIALKKFYPGATVWGIDRSVTALELADENAKANDVSVTWSLSDILGRDEWKKLPLADWIVSNPPYVTESEKQGMQPNVLLHEPGEALFVPDADPMRFYSAIAEFASSHLIRPGRIYLEINERFGKMTCDLLSGHGFRNIRLRKDIHGKDRFVAAGPQ